MSAIVEQKQLEMMSGYKRSYDIELWLRKYNVGYMVGKNGLISTTIDAINGTVIKQQKVGTKVSF